MTFATDRRRPDEVGHHRGMALIRQTSVVTEALSELLRAVGVDAADVSVQEVAYN